jgi:glycosyltransferase involved in cell wall biosynthesis
MQTLSVVLPAYNEGSNILPVYENIVHICQEKGMAGYVELVWVDDGSTDDTWAQIQSIQARSRSPRMKSGQHRCNQGYGAALRTGFSLVTGEYVVPLPSDGEVSILEALKLFEQIGDADVITSSRKRENAFQSAGNSLVRRFLTTTQNMIIKILSLPDMSKFTGVMIFRRDIVKQCHIRLNTGLVRWEVLQYAIQNHYTMIHSTTPTIASPRISGQSKVANPQTALRTFGELLKWRYYLWQNFYKADFVDAHNDFY